MKLETAAELASVLALDYSKGRGNSRAPLEVFYSYSHKDDEFRIALDNHLSPLQRLGLISAWHDRRIGAGSEWKEQIDSHLESADIILLLVSSDFLASDYCIDVELRRALERHKTDRAIVIPIIVRQVDWSGAPFATLQALPRDGKAVSSWSDRDEALADVARGIRKAVEKQASRKKPPPTESPAQKPGPDPRRSRWNGKGRWVFAAILLSLVLGSAIWSYVSTRRSGLPPNVSVESTLEHGKDLYRQKNYAAASNLFRQAAENGSAEAADYLGV
ncbi:MAG: toll/interleukin-1 receptor domain-containing protein, partial [Acidobacteriaceae bacterium]|nr:toll/interleukin-1 receptor domain-containing protein [Acidobacteriaceae bacterium]